MCLEEEAEVVRVAGEVVLSTLCRLRGGCSVSISDEIFADPVVPSSSTCALERVAGISLWFDTPALGVREGPGVPWAVLGVPAELNVGGCSLVGCDWLRESMVATVTEIQTIQDVALDEQNDSDYNMDHSEQNDEEKN